MKKIVLAAAAAAVSIGIGSAQAAEGLPIPKSEWSFSGVFGTFDQAQLQRGYQVYKEVCATCHAMDLIAFRNLADLGYNEDEIKAIAAEYEITDGPNEDGDMFDRAGIPADYFPSPFSNAKAAAASNGGAVPPDLSLLAKARAAGPDHTKAILMGYEGTVPDSLVQQILEDETKKDQIRYENDLEAYEEKLERYEEKLKEDPEAKKPAEPEPAKVFETIEDLGLPDTATFNAYFPGYGIAMAQPIDDEAVEYSDGTPMTLENYAADVSAFMMWAAEPALEDRKQMGIKVIIFLLIFTALLYAAKRKCWSDVH